VTGRVEKTNFASKEKTNVEIPMQLKFDPKKDSALTKEVLSQCTSGPRTLDLSFRIAVKLSLLPFEIKRDQNIPMSCPSDIDVSKFTS
jgi:hypothetical protein